VINRPIAPVKYTKLAAILVAFGLLAAPPLCAQTSATAVTDSKSGAAQSSGTLPNLGDASELTTNAERRMGDRIVRELYRDPDYIDDAVLGDYVQGIWQPLLAAARLRGDLSPELDERFAFEILMGRDRSVNAFALPGGYFGLHMGLLAVVSSRDELASVMGHELSHVTQRHISRLLTKQNSQAPWLLGAMILGVLAASKSTDAANALITGGQAAAAQSQLNFSRDMEREADRLGFGVATQAGFEPMGFVTMFEKLQQASRLNDSGSYPYLRSHPLTTERIADMQTRVQMGTAPAAAAPLTLEHAMMAARANFLTNPGVDTLRQWVAQAQSLPATLADRPREVSVLYGGAMASMKLRDFASAKALLTRLSRATQGDVPASRLARLASAEVALTADDPHLALAVLGAAIAAVPDATATRGANPQPLAVPIGQAKVGSGQVPHPPQEPRPELLLRSQALLASARAPEAAQALQTWLATHPLDAHAWQLLASAYAAQKQTLRAIRAEAEVQMAQLDYTGAADRYKAAQELARELARKGQADHIEASIIDTRARQVVQLLREQAVQR
jgi:predicted Zn-dependent protease